MTEEQLALALDVDPITVSRFERGVTLPSLPTLHKLAGVFGVPMARLLDDAPRLEHADAGAISALLANLSQDERDFLIDTVRRFCALASHRRTR